MKKLISMLIVCLCLVLVGCNNTHQPQVPQTNSAATAVVRRSVITKAEDIPSEQLDYKLESAYRLDNFYIFNYYLGYVENVPLQEVSTYNWQGGPALAYEFKAVKTTTESLSTAASKMVEETTFDNTSVQQEAGIKIGLGSEYKTPLESAKATWNVELNISASRTDNSGKTNANTNTESFENSVSNLESEEQSVAFTFDDSCPIGYYRYVYMGCFDVFTMVVVDLENNTYSISNEALLYRTSIVLDYSKDSKFLNDGSVDKLQFNTECLKNLVIPEDIVVDIIVPEAGYNEYYKSLTYDISSFQETGTVSSDEDAFQNGVLTLYSMCESKDVNKIYIKGAYKQKNKNGIVIQTLINNFRIVFADGWDRDCELILVDVGLIGNGNPLIDISKVSTNYKVKITVVGNNILDGGIHSTYNPTATIVANNLEMSGKGNIEILGADGKDITNTAANDSHGKKGYVGGNAIECDSVSISIENAVIKGGNGGKGQKGGYSWQGPTGTGYSGGNGGNGGIGIIYSENIIIGVAQVKGGNGGVGGDRGDVDAILGCNMGSVGSSGQVGHATLKK